MSAGGRLVLRIRASAVGWAVLLAASAVRSDEFTVEMFSSAFLPSSVTVQAGDDVVWAWRAGDHTVTSGVPGGAPGTPDEPGLLFDVPLDELHAEFRRTYLTEATGSYPFFCRNHPSQVGYVEVSRGETVVRVAVVDDFFNPQEVWVFEGDSVSWEHEPNEGLHSVTSGLSSRVEDSPGALFDVESSDASPIFVYRFAEPGTFPFFCRPHEAMGMKGVVHVQRRFLRGDANGDGAIDLSDPVLILVQLFLSGPPAACPDALDANDDGTVDLSDPVDLLTYLFIGGPPPLRPFPVEGPDRTEDGLRCGP